MKTIVIVILLIMAAAGLTWLLISGSNRGTDEELITTKSGLAYKDLKIGTGKEAKKGDTVTVHYTGLLENGKKFDSSRDRNKPFPFELGAGEVIPGWDEGVAGMKEGGKRKLIIPPELGYGERGAGKGLIPPNAVLLFEIELLKVD
jgi:FKBP-type peptidyl-prolyl cis-trans isomerase